MAANVSYKLYECDHAQNLIAEWENSCKFIFAMHSFIVDNTDGNGTASNTL